MYTRIDYLGLIDKYGNRHGVSLKPGLNVITGRSATGKSSIIEIYDYCMGETRNTIPTGVISDIAAVYFLYINIGNKKWIIGREGKTKHYLIDAKSVGVVNVEGITLATFENAISFGSSDFKKKLSLLYGLDMENTIEREEDKQKGGMSGAPSIRNTMSFILQHQNLIANKLAFFYRFEEKEKREQTIDQFKIFAKYVDANYYAMSLEIDSIKKRVDRLNKIKEKDRDAINRSSESLFKLQEEFKIVTGKEAFQFFTTQDVIANPSKYYEELDSVEMNDIDVDEVNKQYIRGYDDWCIKKNQILAEIRKLQVQRSEVKSTIENLNVYRARLKNYHIPKEVTIDYSICPFCHQHTDVVETEAKQLAIAIDRLNNELLTVNPLIKPQYEELSQLETRLKNLFAKLKDVNTNLEKYEAIIKNLDNNNSLRSQAYKLLVKMQGVVEGIIDINNNLNLDELDSLTKILEEKQAELKSKYDVKNNMYAAESQINGYIKGFRKYLPFESRFDDYDLKFDIKTFELFFVKKEDKIPMRSVGSGSNWLNAHLCLFLAFSVFFNNIIDSSVPSLLFIDQPSQVYFPSRDEKNVFDAKALKQQQGEEANLDHDMGEVTKIFQALYDFCKSQKNTIQVIVTDHADNLKIEGLDNFESIVAARWRDQNKGLIDKTIIDL